MLERRSGRPGRPAGRGRRAARQRAAGGCAWPTDFKNKNDNKNNNNKENNDNNNNNNNDSNSNTIDNDYHI